VSYNLQYGDGLTSQVGSDVKSTVHTLSPRVVANFAERITVSYSPSFTWYSNSALDRHTNHIATASIAGMIDEVSVNGGLNYSSSEDPLVETGRQTKQESWGASASAGFPLTDRTTLDANVSQQTRLTDTFADVRSYSGGLYARYAYTPQLDLSLGGSISHNEVDPGADLLSRQITGRAGWRPGPRLNVDLEVGLDISKMDDSNRGNESNPVYGLNLSYQLFEPTRLSIGGRRSIGASYFADQFSKNTGWNVSVSQRLLTHFSLSAGYDYSTNDYVSKDTGGTAVGRSDTYKSFYAQLGTSFLQHWSAAITYRHGSNDSNVRLFARDTTVYGLSVSWSL